MNRLGVAGLGLIVMFAQQPLEAQRAASQASQSRQADQIRDTEFLNLYRQVSGLEKKLEDEPPETEERRWTKSYLEDGKLVEQELTGLPSNISDKILEIRYKEVKKLASRYGITFDQNESGIFTFGNSLVIKLYPNGYSDGFPFSGMGYAIFNPFRAVIATSSDIDEERANYHYNYQVLKSIPVKSGYTIVRGEVISDGFIPLFETPDFDGIVRIIKQLERYNKMKDTSGFHSNLNRAPEFQVLNYDNTRADFAEKQLYHIGMMLLNLFENSPELNGLPNPKMDIDMMQIPRVGGNRIILAGHCFGDLGAGLDKLDSHPPEEKGRKEIKPESSLSGDMTLSIAGNGVVSYFFQPYPADYNNLRPPVNRELKIKFPNIK